jgi:hypothetical protein
MSLRSVFDRFVSWKREPEPAGDVLDLRHGGPTMFDGARLLGWIWLDQRRGEGVALDEVRVRFRCTTGEIATVTVFRGF